MAGTGCAIVVVLAFVGYSWIGAWPSLGACEQLLHEYRDAETPASVLHVPLACSALRAKTHSEAPDAAQISTVVKNSASETLRRAQTERAVFDGPRVGTQAVTVPETQRESKAQRSQGLPMALSERSLRDLRKIADLDARTEAAQAAKDVADRRATAL